MVGIVKRALVAAAVSAAASSAALAADVAPVMPAPPPVVVAPPPAPVFDWSGFYVGTRTQGLFCTGICWMNIEGHAGYNFAFSRVLVGVEAGGGWWTEFGAGGWTVNASVRTGVVLGRALAYGRIGYAAYGGGGFNTYVTFGGGVELSLGQRLSVFAEVAAERYSGGGLYPGIAVGVNLHLGN